MQHEGTDVDQPAWEKGSLEFSVTYFYLCQNETERADENTCKSVDTLVMESRVSLFRMRNSLLAFAALPSGML